MSLLTDTFAWQWVWRAALFLAMNGCMGYAAWSVARRLLPGAWPCERVLAAGVVFFAAVTAVGTVLGFAGLIALPWFVAAAVILFAVSLFLKTSEVEPEPMPDQDGPVVLPSGVFVLACYAVLGFVLLSLWAVATHPPPGGDGYIYHLTFPATWLHAGRIQYVPLPYGVQAATYYPLNTELFYLWLMMPLHEDVMCNAAQLPALALCALAVYCLCRRMGAAVPGALAGACAVLLVPGFVQQAAVARVDLFFTLWFVACVYFIYRWRETGSGAHLFFAGACWGLFLGAKSLAVLYSACLVVPFAAALWKRGAGDAVKAVFATGALMLAFGGFWYVRNWLITGNPFYPLEMSLGGATLFPGAYGRAAMQVFHTNDPDELRRILLLFTGAAPAAVMMVCGALAARRAVAALRKKDTAPAAGVLILPLLIFVLFWWVNPHNNLTNGRFLFPAFALMCVYPAVVIGSGRGRQSLMMQWVLFAALAYTAVQQRTDHVMRLSRDVLDAMWSGGGGLLGDARWALAALACAWAFAGAVLLMRNRPGMKSARAALCVLCALCLFAGVCLSWQYHRGHKYQWLAHAGPVGQGWRALDEFADHAATVASVGNERAYPLFGTGLRHRVVTVNVDAHPAWQFHDYERAARARGYDPSKQNERPQVHRAHADIEAWLRNLRAGGVDLLFCTTLDPIAARFMKTTPDGFPVEVEWMRARPDLFRVLFRLQSGRPGGEAVEIFAFRRSST